MLNWFGSGRPGKLSLGLAFGIFLPFCGANASAGPEVVLHSFLGGSDGSIPLSEVIADQSGNLFGTTSGGGAGCTNDCGTVYKLAPDGTETILYAFTGGTDGANPGAGLIFDSAGNLYGTTSAGGSQNLGTVFRLTPDGSETVLYSFAAAQTDGHYPNSTLVVDGNGNLYGTTESGGSICGNGNGCGTVFELAPDGTETVLYAFTGPFYGDGNRPNGVIRDKKGNLFGTTVLGGDKSCANPGCGTVFRISPRGKETVLHAFSSSEGEYPRAKLVQDQAGNLYGTTYNGGNFTNNCFADSCGTVFKIAPDGTESVLYSFSGVNGDGANPASPLIVDDQGNLYGTTEQGGSGTKCNYGRGTVFKLTPTGVETVLYSFGSGTDGANPWAGLTSGPRRTFWGTTMAGGTGNCSDGNYVGCGTVFEIKNPAEKGAGIR